MSVAIDSSHLNAEAARMRTEIRHLTTATQDTHHALGRIEGQVQSLLDVLLGGAQSGDAAEDGFAAKIAYVAHRSDELQRGVYHISAGVERATALVDAVAARGDRLQLGVDALRLGQQSSAEAASMRQDEARRRSEALSAKSDALMSRTDVLMSGSHALMSRSDVLISRMDGLALRSTIPLGSEILMRLPEGLLLVPAEDSALVTAVWEGQGHLEPGTVKVIVALLEEGDHVVDVGANIGLVTLPAARAVGPTGHVIALEPASRIADVLERSMFLNLGRGRVTLHRRAAGDRAGTASLHLGATAGHSSLLPLPDSGRSEEVEVVRLDDLVEPGRRIRLVKIDAEGFELSVWRGMERILADNPDLAVVVEFGPEHLRRAEVGVDEWLDSFLAPGYAAYEIDETDGVLRPLRPRADLRRVSSLNLLLLRRPASAYPTLAFA